MKKFFAMAAVVCLLLMHSGCADNIGGSYAYGEDSGSISETDGAIQEERTVMYLYIGDDKIEVTLEDNEAVKTLKAMLAQGDITYTASDYGGFEKVGGLGYALPTADTRITTQAGDIMLYSGNQIVLFYGSNTWSYTRLGRINGCSESELRTLLRAGGGDVRIRMSLQ